MGTSGAAFIALFKLRETARRPLPGSMPSVASHEEVAELVETQEENPDLDVEEIFAVAPAHLVDTEPTVAEAQAEVEVALANEAEARERLERAERATAAAQQAVAAAQEREDVSGNVTYLSQGSAATQEREEHESESDEADEGDRAGEADGDA